jgi:hypothetical protein
MKNTLIFIFLVCIGFAYGQNKNATTLKSNDLDQSYTPPLNSVFDEDSKKNENNNQSIADFKNVIRFNPFLLTRSIAAVAYERSLNDYIGLEAYLGYSYKLDNIQAISIAINSDEFSMGDKKSVIGVDDMIANGTFKSGGIYGSIGTKIYLDGSPNEGSYFGIQARYNSYDIDLNNSNFNSYMFLTPEDTYTKIKSITTVFQWGTSMIGGTSKVPVVHEFYTGIGLRSSSYDIYDQKEIDVNGANATRYFKSTLRESQIGFSYVIGYTFGFGFKTKK